MVKRLRALPWWGQVLLVFLASRIVTTAVMLAFAANQAENAWTEAKPSLIEYSTMWDAHWYFIISQTGYPSDLPLDADGHVMENAWAFMPVYPMLCRVLMAVTGMPWEIVSVGVSVLSAAGFSLLLYRLLSRVVERGALFGVALVLFSPLSPVFQVGYAESLHLLMLTAALIAWIDRDWRMVLVLIPIMSLTRPSGLAFAFALLLAMLLEWKRAGRWPWTLGAFVRRASLVAWGTFWGLAWLLICALVTGDLSSYTETELVWRADYIGRTELIPFTPWIAGFTWWFGGAWGPVYLSALIALVVIWFAKSRGPARMGEELTLWVVAYLLYLLAVFFPQSSTFRLLMPVFPLVAAFTLVQGKAAKTLIFAGLILLQGVWIAECWHVADYDWTPP
ncbi:hypothetical protein [Humidisolicoccus flavus]|uniref:hypothetical protein n=1 Tax=Humidisolicoccus flavus TaxID=3111414 RepID=UPI00324480BA